MKRRFTTVAKKDGQPAVKPANGCARQWAVALCFRGLLDANPLGVGLKRFRGAYRPLFLPPFCATRRGCFEAYFPPLYIAAI